MLPPWAVPAAVVCRRAALAEPLPCVTYPGRLGGFFRCIPPGAVCMTTGGFPA
ncbi:hypothetical protein DWUX_1862 [Desulfovibrio diazotrophicus]|nr:hypothetical protein DWUX_1862 [Desulfovibrio diazotrophicus]